MKKNRYLLCLLLCAFMLYYAIPKLSIKADGAYGIFSLAWLLFALIVIAGNLTGILYSPKQRIQKTNSGLNKKKLRSFE